MCSLLRKVPWVVLVFFFCFFYLYLSVIFFSGIEVEFVVFAFNFSDSSSGHAVTVGKHGSEPEIGTSKVLIMLVW